MANEGATGQLAGQVAVITGAGKGIGRSSAIALGRKGMRVVCNARTLTDVEDTAAQIVSEGGQAFAQRGDVASKDDMEALMSAAVDRYGRLDFLLLNAAVSGLFDPASGQMLASPLESLSIELWQRYMDVNLTGAFLGLRAAIPHMRATGGGRVVGIGSGVAISANALVAAYAASKAGFTVLLKSAARELREFNIAVNEIHPGSTATPTFGVQVEEDREPRPGEFAISQRDPDGHWTKVPVALTEAVAAHEEASKVTSGRFLTRQGTDWFKSPEVVAELVVFLATMPNDGVTGQLFSLQTAR